MLGEGCFYTERDLLKPISKSGSHPHLISAPSGHEEPWKSVCFRPHGAGPRGYTRSLRSALGSESLLSALGDVAGSVNWLKQCTTLLNCMPRSLGLYS